MLAIFGSLSSDFLILVVALLLFGKRFPEIATTLGRKMYQFKRGLEDLKMEIAKPIRDELQAPLREASEMAKSAARSVDADVRGAAGSDYAVSATPAPAATPSTAMPAAETLPATAPPDPAGAPAGPKPAPEMPPAV